MDSQSQNSNRQAASLIMPEAPIETDMKQETEVDIAVEDQKSTKKLQKAVPLDLTIIQPDFTVQNGAITLSLYVMNATSSDVKKETYKIDTVTQSLCKVFRGKLTPLSLSSGFRVDTQVVNPIRPQEFKIRNKVVSLPKDCLFPFAIIPRDENVYVMWTANETHRNHVIKALQSFDKAQGNNSQDAAEASNSVIQMTEQNWYRVQAYTFLKREYELKFNPNALLIQNERGEEDGGEPAVNADDEASDAKIVAGFSLQTVTDNEQSISGYLYKTVQSVGIMSSTYFLRRFYMFDKQTKVLTVHEKPTGKAQHSFHLDKCLLKVDMNLNTFLRPDYMKHFTGKIKDLQLPSDNPLPMALFISERCQWNCCKGTTDIETQFERHGNGHGTKISILWASTDLDYDLWTKAFIETQQLQVDEPLPNVESATANRFIKSLYSALLKTEENVEAQPVATRGTSQQQSRPRVHSMDARRMPDQNNIKDAESTAAVASYQSATLHVNEQKVEGLLMKTSQKLKTTRGFQTEPFHHRHYMLDKLTNTLYISRINKNQPDLTVKLYEHNNQVIDVDTNLSNSLVVNYKKFFKNELKSSITTPEAFPYPLSVRLQNNQIMILWAASMGERSIWAHTFNEIKLKKRNSSGIQNATPPKLIIIDQNEFVATLYKCLVPANSLPSSGLIETKNKKGFRIRIIQSGILMKTSQKCNKKMQKSNFHMRFFELNVSTCELKVFNDLSPQKKVKHNIDLRNKVVTTKCLQPKLKSNYAQILGKNGANFDTTLPHDFKFPFALIYVSDKQLCVMLLWAQSAQSRKEWMDGFNFIKVENCPLYQTHIPIENQFETKQSKLFVTQLFTVLEKVQPTALEPKDEQASNAIKEETKQEERKNDNQQNVKISKSDDELIEEAWARFKKVTPVEKLISGQDTFQIQSKYSMGLIRARKEVFDNNYDPDTIIKCFLLIDFESQLVGIRSVDASFSALVKIKTSDMVRIQDNDFDIHAQDDGSEQLSNTIDLILDSKVISIAPNHIQEKTMICNELKRAQMMQPADGEAEQIASKQSRLTAASNQQHRSENYDNDDKSHIQERISRQSRRIDRKISLISKAEEYEGNDFQQNAVMSSTVDDIANSVAPEEHNPISKSKKIVFQGQDNNTQQTLQNPRKGRFQRDSVENEDQMHKKDRYDTESDHPYTMNEQLHSANNQQDAVPRLRLKDSTTSAKMQQQPQVIPLNRIKFTQDGGSGTNLGAQDSFNQGGTNQRVRTNSFFEETDGGAQPKPQEMQEQDRVMRLDEYQEEIGHQAINDESSHRQNVADVQFFRPQSSSNRHAAFNQNTNSDRAAPIKIKLAKKRTENSQVRESLKQSIMNSQTGKIDFHKTVSFREAFPTSAGGAQGVNPLGMMSMPAHPMMPRNTQEDYEQKIEASRDQGFLDNLLQSQNTPKADHQSNRFMSPALRLQSGGDSFKDDANRWNSGNDLNSTQQLAPNLSILSATQPMSMQIRTTKLDFTNPDQPVLQNPPVDDMASLRQQIHQTPFDNSGTNSYNRAIQNQANQRGNRPYDRRQIYANQEQESHNLQQQNLQDPSMINQEQNENGGDISDWDDDSGDEFNQTAKSIKNVRDRTFSLSNVYTGQIMSPMAASTAGDGNQAGGQGPRKLFQGVSNMRQNSVGFKNRQLQSSRQHMSYLEVEDWD